MEKKMLVLLTIVDGQVVVKGVCELDNRDLADEWKEGDKHRQIHEVDVLE